MAGRSLTLARTRAQARLVAAIGATVVVLVFALSFALGWLTDAVRDAVVDAVAAAAPADRHTVLQIPATEDPDAQAERARTLLAARFGGSLDVVEQIGAAGSSSRWTLTVDPETFTPWTIAWTAADLADLGVLAKAVPDLAPGGASTEGGLAGTLEDATAGVLAVGAVVPVPLALTAIAGVIAVLQLARLLGRARTAEIALLRARGLDRATERRMAFMEAVAVVGSAALVGWAAAVGVVVATGSTLVAVLTATWPVPALALLVLAGVAGGAQVRGQDAHAVRGRTAVTGLSTLVLVVAAAFFLWQLSGLHEDAAALTENAWSLIVVAVAPALGLAAIAALALSLFGPVAGGVARAAARRPGLSPVLPARMTARHVTAFGVVVALLALGSGGASFAGLALGTWQSASAETSALVTGADARATVGSGVVGPDAVATAAEATGVATAAGVFADAASAGGASLQVVGIPASSTSALLTPVPAAGVDPRRLAEAITTDTVLGAPLGAATGIRMSFAVTAGGGSEPTVPDAIALGGEAWFVDALGTPTRVALDLAVDYDESTKTVRPQYPYLPDGPVDTRWGRGTLTATAELPVGAGEWTFVGFTLGFTGTVGSQTPTVHPVELSADGGPALAWPSTEDIVLSDGARTVTMTFAPAPESVPVVVTDALAQTLGLAEDGTFEIALDRSGRRIPARIADVVRAIPGTAAASAALVPADTTTLALVATAGTAVSPTELWASGDGAADAVAEALPAAAVRDAAHTGTFTRALVLPWWIAVAATGLLAGVALFAAAMGLAQQRGTDVFVLRALGLTAGRQSTSRTGELVAVAVGALAAGAVLGIPLALAAIPALTRVAVVDVPDILSAAVSPGILPLGLLLGLVGASIAAASVVVGRVIVRQSAAGRVREVA